MRLSQVAQLSCLLEEDTGEGTLGDFITVQAACSILAKLIFP